MTDLPCPVAPKGGVGPLSVIGLPLLSVCGISVTLFEGAAPVKAATVRPVTPPVKSLPRPTVPLAPLSSVFDVAPGASDCTVKSVMAFGDFVFVVPLTVASVVEAGPTVLAGGWRVMVVPALTVVVEVAILFRVVEEFALDRFGIVGKEVMEVVNDMLADIGPATSDMPPPEVVLAVVRLVVVSELVF